MPTGYTADVQDGKVTDLKDFAAQCARGMGAFMHQRDDDDRLTLRYPARPQGSYYEKSLDEAMTERHRWVNLSEEAKYAEWSEYARKQTVSLHESIARVSESRARYQRMLAQVEAVEVPSLMQTFKNFMVEQLTSSIDFDCGKDDRFERDYYRVQDFYDWCDTKEARTLRDVDYYAAEFEKEQDRYYSNREYIETMAATFGFEVKEPDE